MGKGKGVREDAFSFSGRNRAFCIRFFDVVLRMALRVRLIFPCCHAADESTIFFEFILSRIDKILDDISDQISEKNEYLSESVQKKSSSTGD